MMLSSVLRTIGVNFLLACMGMPVCARSLTVYPARPVTSLRTADSLAANESYFFAELKRLKMIIDRLNAGEKLFIILDEILKGTNSKDKQKGSLALMKQLIAKEACGIIATHDLLLGTLEDEFPHDIKNYRFEADITDNTLTFSYRMREGVARNMNDLPDSIKHLVKGGGSLTALPVIETQAGDVSAYIPTNVISITDGQIFLESDLFNSGVRPAINVGISVSRVGGSAQIKSMKKVAGTLKLDQAQFRELAAFAKFGSDLDAATSNVIEKGKRNVEILKQPSNTPYKVEDQVAIIYVGSKNLLRQIPVESVREFEKEYLENLRASHEDTLLEIKAGKINDEITSVLENVAKEVAKKYIVK